MGGSKEIQCVFDNMDVLSLEDVLKTRPGRAPPAAQPCCGFVRDEIIHGVAKSVSKLDKETRDELVSKVREVRESRRNNEEAVAVPPNVAYPGNSKQSSMFQWKDFCANRNKSKDKRKQNYAFSRRE